MMDERSNLPRILVIDDVFGRTVPGGLNHERADLCRSLLLEDVTEDAGRSVTSIAKPLAQAVFCRAQTPVNATVGNTVENDLDGCLAVVRSGWINKKPNAAPWALVLLDLCFYTGEITADDSSQSPGVPVGRTADDQPATYFGLEILKALRLEFPNLPVVILSGNPKAPVSRLIDTQGALGFIGSADPNALKILSEYLAWHGLICDDEIVGYSIPLLMALRSARRLGSASRNVLIRGESGTGKELLAKYAHKHGRPSKPFVVVNSGLLNPNLYASALFGHKRGAFTGATGDKRGLILQANGGDLFLDEIARLPPDVQAGLLRVLQDRVVRPEGADDAQGVTVDVRFLVATNEDIEGQAIAGQFRDDLLERLRFGGGTIQLPALRDRREDIPLLADRFFRGALHEHPTATVRSMSVDAIELLRTLDWPGNVRALESCIKKAVSDYPHVDRLYPLHFEAPRPIRRASDREPIAPPAPAVPPPVAAIASSLALPDLLHSVEQFDPATIRPIEMNGALPRVQQTFQRFLVRLLEVALIHTSRATPEAPEGRVMIHPAMKLLRGDPKLSASSAADDVKRLLVAPELRAGRVLEDAYETAARLRPKMPKKSVPPVEN